MKGVKSVGRFFRLVEKAHAEAESYSFSRVFKYFTLFKVPVFCMPKKS